MASKLRELVTKRTETPATIRVSAKRFRWETVAPLWDEAIAMLVGQQ
jgi:hypothetical protein